MFIRSVLLALILFTAYSSLTFQEYAQLQKENPQNLLESISFDDQSENFPEINKLMFLTPWNKKGHQLTIKYANKIDYVSPCWYSLKLSPKGTPIFQNQHNYDQTFALAIKKSNPNIKLIPRVYVQGSDVSFFQNIGSNQNKFTIAVNLIKRIVDQKQLDGIVWDSPFDFYQKSRSSLNQLVTQFIQTVRNAIGKDKIIFFNIGNPMDHMNSLEVALYKSLPVDAILIQNYDKGDKYMEMVLKSIEWSKKLDSSTKIILMLPFFSVKVNVGSLSTQQAVKSLKRQGVTNAQLHNGICLFTQNKSHRKFIIPCLSYFSQVFKLAQQNSMDVGFWQGGNGLQNYYEFL